MRTTDPLLSRRQVRSHPRRHPRRRRLLFQLRSANKHAENFASIVMFVFLRRQRATQPCCARLGVYSPTVERRRRRRLLLDGALLSCTNRLRRRHACIDARRALVTNNFRHSLFAINALKIRKPVLSRSRRGCTPTIRTCLTEGALRRRTRTRVWWHSRRCCCRQQTTAA